MLSARGGVHSDLRILHASTQRLIVQLRKNDLKLILLCGHAPSGNDAAQLDSWWIATTHAIPTSKRSWPLIAMLDANARVGSLTSTSIGPAGAEPENIAGNSFHQWLHDSSLFLPQTMEDMHTGDHHTWVHSSGSTSRLDYIAIDHSLNTPGIRSYITPIDLTISRLDHFSVCVEIPLERLLASDRNNDGSRPSPNEALMTPPTTPWATDVHSHAALLQRWMKQFVPPPNAARKRKTHLSEQTWCLIRQKKYHWNRCRQILRLQRHSLLREVFAAWASRPSQLQKDDHASLGPWLRLCDQSFALHFWHHRLLSAKVLSGVRADDRAYYETLATN